MNWGEIKLLHEAIYKEMCFESSQDMASALEDNDDLADASPVFAHWVNLRLQISGGDKHGSSTDMTDIKNLLDELEMFDNLCADTVGDYRGMLSWELWEQFLEVVYRVVKDPEYRETLFLAYENRFFAEDERPDPEERRKYREDYYH